MKNKLIFIGPYAGWRPPTNGQTAKNQALLRRCIDLYDKVYSVDTSSWRRNPLVIIKMLFTLLFIRNASIVIAICDDSAYKLIRLMYLLRVRSNILYFVIGGGLADKLKAKIYNIKFYHNLKTIIVEGLAMQKCMYLLGLSNTIYWPNLRYMHTLPLKQNEYSYPIRFVFLSRVEVTKGCNVILDAVSSLNLHGCQNKFEVDFFGTIDLNYAEEFYRKIGLLPNVSYKGFLDLADIKGYEILNMYDMMLFPTFYHNEGFPGVLIDASMCGLPVIASDWHLNSEIIEDNINGYIVSPKNSHALAEKMLEIINNPKVLGGLSLNARSKSLRYNIESVMTHESLKELGYEIVE